MTNLRTNFYPPNSPQNFATPIHALIVAAGKGSRFGTEVPKQYLKTQDKTILQHSVARLNHPQITDLTIVIAPDDKVASNLSFEFTHPIYFACGGCERFLSVQNGVKAIIERGASDDDWVLIHDAARPCLALSDLAALITKIQKTPNLIGAILASPVTDTIKFVENHAIRHTIDRSQLWAAQTPQIFRLKALEKMLQTVIAKNLIITDEASGFEMMGEKIAIVPSKHINIKLTYPQDLMLIQALLTQD